MEKCEQTAYDVIVLDLDMPIMSGYEACRKIKMKGDNAIKDILHIDQSILRMKRFDEEESKAHLGPGSFFCAMEDGALGFQQPLLVALSALVTEQVAQRCLECGFDEVSKS